MVIDTSALIAIFFNEKSGPWALDRMQESASQLRMSLVNYTETLILVEDRQPRSAQEIRQAIDDSGIRLIAPTRAQAETAASARLRYPLNLGDCFAYALAKAEDCPLLTLDRDFRQTDVQVVLPGR